METIVKPPVPGPSAPPPVWRRFPAGTWLRVGLAAAAGLLAALVVSAIVPGPPKAARPVPLAATRQQAPAPAAAAQQSQPQRQAARYLDVQGPPSAPRNVADEKGVRWDDKGVAVWGLDLEGQRVKNVAPGNLIRIGGPEGELFQVLDGGVIRPYQP